MQEIILYAVLALIVVAMLYSVLGKNIGNDPTQGLPGEIKNAFGMDDKPFVEEAPMQFEGPGAEGLTAIAKIDRSFNVAQFLDGAKVAYGMILDSFAEGDKDTLRELLNDEVYEAYVSAIDERAVKGLTQNTDLARLISAEIVDSSLKGKIGRIRVLYEAELATALIDKDGQTIEGDMDILSLVKEVWDFERNLGASSPNWILSGVEPAMIEDGGTLTPDPSPDTE